MKVRNLEYFLIHKSLSIPKYKSTPTFFALGQKTYKFIPLCSWPTIITL